MKVKCIKPNWVPWGRYVRNLFGKRKWKDDIVTVVDEYWSQGKKYYYLMEWPEGGQYDSKGFIPLEENYQSISYKEIKEKASVN